MNRKAKTILLGLICLLSLGASGCVETSMMYRGNIVPPVHVVALQENGPNVGRWETFDIIIDYEYVHDGDLMEISGQLRLGQHYQAIYDQLRYLDVYLFFVNEQSRVLETVLFTRNMNSDPEETFSISRRYNVPAGTAGISFGYSGTVRELGSHARFYQLDSSFYLLPLTR